MKITSGSIGILLIIFTLLSAPLLWAQHSSITHDDAAAKDVYEAGGSVQVANDIEGDVVVAGGSISVANSVAGDVLAAGGTINITARVRDDIRAAGGSVAITGDVGDDAIVAGGTIMLDSGSNINGRAWLSGGTITVAGNVNRELKASGGHIILTGTIGGDVVLYAKSIEIKPSAIIKGNLTYSSPEDAIVSKGAAIEGEIYRNEMDTFDDGGANIISTLVLFLSLAASAIAVFLLFPQLSIAVTKRLQRSPAKCSGVGILALFITPFVALMLLVSVLGIPLGLMVLALYCAVLIVGLLISIILIGDTVYRQMGKQPDVSKRTRATSIVVAAAALLVLYSIPLIGGVVFFIVLLLGAGGVTQFLYQLYTNRDDNVTTLLQPTD